MKIKLGDKYRFHVEGRFVSIITLLSNDRKWNKDEYNHYPYQTSWFKDPLQTHMSRCFVLDENLKNDRCECIEISKLDRLFYDYT